MPDFESGDHGAEPCSGTILTIAIRVNRNQEETMNKPSTEQNAPPSQPVLETDRLILRPFALSDAKEVQRLAGDVAVADTTLNIPHPYPDGAAEEFISSHPAKYAHGEAVTFAITLKEDGSLIGGVGLNVAKRFCRAELGYWIAKAFWNQGFATEAGRAVIEFGFVQWGLHKIVGTYFSRNPASGCVMKKIGLVQEGLLRDHVIKWDCYEDVVACAIIKP
jgi:ribosomal-protein-alanine N-acetyltransferase